MRWEWAQHCHLWCDRKWRSPSHHRCQYGSRCYTQSVFLFTTTLRRKLRKKTFKNDCLSFWHINHCQSFFCNFLRKEADLFSKLLTRTAPIPAVTFSALGSCDASVKMNHIDVLLALRLLGIFSRSSSRNPVSADKRGSDNRPSYACCVTADRHRLATLPKICPAANCIRPFNLRASFLDIRPELINPAIVSDNSVVPFFSVVDQSKALMQSADIDLDTQCSNLGGERRCLWAILSEFPAQHP